MIVRNTYTLIDSGDFVDGSNSSVADPYIQLLPTTDRASAHADFVNVRLGGQDTTDSQAALLSEADAKHSPTSKVATSVPTSSESTKDKIKNLFTKSIWFIVAVAVGGAVALALFVYVLYACCCRRKSYVRNEAVFVPTMCGPGAYARLRDSHYGQNQQFSNGQGYISAYGPYGNGGNGYVEPKYQYGGKNV